MLVLDWKGCSRVTGSMLQKEIVSHFIFGWRILGGIFVKPHH